MVAVKEVDDTLNKIKSLGRFIFVLKIDRF